MRKYIWIFLILILTVLSKNIRAGDSEYKKTGELYYQIFRDNERRGYIHTVFYETQKDKIKWIRIEQKRKEEVKKWFSDQTSQSHCVIMLKDNRFYSMKTKGEKNSSPYEVDIQPLKDGLRLVVMADKKVKEGMIKYSEYDYTSIDSPYMYLKLYNTPYTLNIFDLDEHDILKSTITLMRKEKMEDLHMPFNAWVVSVRNERSKRTDWITPDGILIQSAGKDRDGSFLIRACSKEQALLGF